MNDSNCAAAIQVPLDPVHLDAVVRNVPEGLEGIQAIRPLSPLQEGILFHHLLDARADTYIMSTLFELQSEQSVRVLIDALEKVAERHELLRSCFMWKRLPGPVQVVQRRIAIHAEKLQLEPSDDPLDQLKLLTRPGRGSLELERAPLMRLTTAGNEGTSKCYALLQIHHLICDYRSWRRVIEEVLAHACSCEHELSAPVPSANSLVRPLTAEQCEEAKTYFRARLSHIDEPVAPFGALAVRGDVRQAAEVSRVLEPLVVQQLRSRARSGGWSVARLFHAAWALVVAATSRRTEVVFGTALSTSRGATRSLATVGMAVNTLPLRLDLRGISVQGLLDQTHRELEELLRHERAPLTLAQHCSGIDGTAPLFTALLNYRHATSASAERRSDAPKRVLAHTETWTNNPLALTVDYDGQGNSLLVQARCGIDPQRIAGYVEMAVCSLADALHHAPNTPALSISILPTAEARLVTHGLNATHVAYDREALIHELFEAQVEQTPDTCALLHGQHSLTYAELNCRANQLAQYLRECGVKSDSVVAICIERSLDMVIALLGILKAGAAYMPLDPTYPSERLRYMLDDARPALVLADQYANLPQTAAGILVLRLGELRREIAGSDTQNLRAEKSGLGADRLLYVIYTSGSTGAPKGTAMPHRSMVNLIEWHRRTLPASGGVRVLQFAALSFDVAFQEVFSTLCTGGQLVLIDEAVRRDPRALIDLLQHQRVERMFLPPVMLQGVAEHFVTAPTFLESLRDIVVAGEQLRISAEIANFFQRLPGCRLHNHYGPTETHVVTALTLSGEPADWPTLPAIGQPIANTQIYVLDDALQPVPLSVEGEIYIGGANLARGYLNRPQLSAERFVPDPFNPSAGARMYKTGDLGRWRADGMIEYLGRNDDQVKIRGFRVELGEIEAQLARQQQVKEVVVVAREETPGSRCLVAYVTLRGSHPGGAEALRTFAKSVLPEYMVPGAYVILDRLPLTPSGKIARRTLPPPGPEAYARSSDEAPRGEVEQELEQIWRKLLHIDRVGRDANFFELGGHSLHGIRLVTTVEARFGVRLPVMTVFEYPTLAQQAALISSAYAAGMQDDESEFDEGIIPSSPVAGPAASL
jgi:amino acid adenylation domain-containing protein